MQTGHLSKMLNILLSFGLKAQRQQMTRFQTHNNVPFKCLANIASQDPCKSSLDEGLSHLMIAAA